MGLFSVVGNIGTLEGYAFRMGAATGQLAAAGAGDLFQFRWVNPAGVSKRIRILEVRVSAVADSAAGTTAGANLTLNLFMARSWTADGSGGTTLLTQGSNANNQKLRTKQQPSQVTARIATTAPLTAGTRTLDAQAAGIIVTDVPITALGGASQVLPDTVLYDANVGNYVIPLVLDNQEGFVIQNTAVPAAATLQVAVTVLWTEVDGGLVGG